MQLSRQKKIPANTDSGESLPEKIAIGNKRLNVIILPGIGIERKSSNIKAAILFIVFSPFHKSRVR